MMKILKNHKIAAILSSIVILLPMLAGGLLWEKLPETLKSGNIHASKIFIVFFFPLILLAIHLICMAFTLQDNKDNSQNKEILNIGFMCVPVISLIAGTGIYKTALNQKFNETVITIIALSLLFIIVGNYMPKISKNRTVGIKIYWTLKNENNWSATHRFSGKLWVICGFLMLSSTLLPKTAMITAAVILSVITVFSPVIYSYSFYKRNKL